VVLLGMQVEQSVDMEWGVREGIQVAQMVQMKMLELQIFRFYLEEEEEAEMLMEIQLALEVMVEFL
jgi:hypothetical protein